MRAGRGRKNVSLKGGLLGTALIALLLALGVNLALFHSGGGSQEGAAAAVSRQIPPPPFRSVEIPAKAPQSAHRRRSAGATYPGSFSDSPPFPKAEQVSLEEAKKIVLWTLMTADHPLANNELLVTVWVSRTEDPELALVYSSGIMITEEIRQFDGDLTKKFQAFIDQGFVGRIGEIHGLPALISLPHVDDAGDSLDSVEFRRERGKRHGVWILRGRSTGRSR